jgi:hypothetical protein
MPPIQKFKLRRDPAARWQSVNPVLSEGEPGFETDTGRLKIGDGTKTWLQLPYFIPLVAGDAPVPAAPGAVTPVPSTLDEHVYSEAPHPVYDDGRNFFILYENAKV